jgi:hypothetical protein
MSRSKPKPPFWEARLQRRHEFCERFVREHHPGMTDAHKLKGAHPLKPLDGPAYFRADNMAADWWLQTDDSMCALGYVWLAHLFDRRGMLDHDWMIGRSDQEPWALISEPYSHVKAATIAELATELKDVGVELLEYSSEQSTHAPGQTLMLVANVLSIHALMGAVARLIVAECPPLRIDDDEESDQTNDRDLDRRVVMGKGAVDE